MKLGQLTLSSEQQSQNLNSENENDANYNVNDGDSTENPWNKAGASAQPTQAKQPEPAAKSGVYVPPSVTRGEVCVRSQFIPSRFKFCYHIDDLFRMLELPAVRKMLRIFTIRNFFHPSVQKKLNSQKLGERMDSKRSSMVANYSRLMIKLFQFR